MFADPSNIKSARRKDRHPHSGISEVGRADCVSAGGADDSSAQAEPKTLRYRLLHTAARIVRGQRKRKIKIPETWPWAADLATAFGLAFALTPI